MDRTQQIDRLEARFDNLRDDISQQTIALGVLTARMGDVVARLDTAATEIRGAGERLARHDERIEALTDSVTELATALNAHTNRLSVVESDIRADREHVTSLTTSVAKLARAVDQRLGSVDKLATAVDSRLGTIDGRLGTVEKLAMTLDSRLGSVEKELHALNSNARLLGLIVAIGVALLAIPTVWNWLFG
jgi:chromosome segregation ATPase